MVSQSPVGSTSATLIVDQWLVDAGFHFNPFKQLDASRDPRIGAYLVHHLAFAAIWGDGQSLAFAPAGGGKTALRIQVMRACWHGPSTDHAFPISYIPTMDKHGHLPASLDAHLRAILQSAALQLYVALLMRPHWWRDQESQTQELVRALLDYDLRDTVPYYLDQLVDPDDLASFLTDHGQLAVWTDIPDYSRWRPVRDALAETAPAAVPADAIRRLDVLLDVLLRAFGLSSVYLLVDGIDGFVETAHHPQSAVELVEPLLGQAAHWSRQRLFLKAFLPIEVLPVLEASHAAVVGSCRRTMVQWSTPSLAEVVRQRVFVATQGAFGSLDALSTPDIVDIETQLAQAVTPLPREILILSNRLLWEHARRADDVRKLDVPDLEAALAWYEDQRVSDKHGNRLSSRLLPGTGD